MRLLDTADKKIDLGNPTRVIYNKCLAPLRDMLVGIKKKISCRVESKFTRC
jgi:hypothetical protein